MTTIPITQARNLRQRNAIAEFLRRIVAREQQERGRY